MEHATQRVADWLDGVSLADGEAAPDIWACVEIFGHRKHYGRTREVERFGTKMLRVDVPSRSAAPLMGEIETFETYLYGGASIFSFTPMTEEAARKWAEHERPRPYTPMARLPSPHYRDECENEVPF